MVFEAMNPGSAAERPATAMNTSAFVSAMYFSSSSGFLWADRTLYSTLISNCFNFSYILSPIILSLLLPIINETVGFSFHPSGHK